MKLNYRTLPPLILASLLMCLIIPTLTTSQYIVSDDMRIPEVNIDAALSKDIYYTWQYFAGLGEPGHLNIVDIFPYHFIIYLFLKSGLNYILVQKLFIAFSFIAAGLGMYYLLTVVFNGKRPLGAFFGGLFYVVNPFAIAIPYYHFYNIFMLPYIFIPILLGNIINILDKNDKKYYLQVVIIFIFNLSSLSNPAYLIIEFIPVGFYIIYKLSLDTQKLMTIRRVGIYLVLFLLINSFWILPFVNQMESNSYSNIENSPIRIASPFHEKYTQYSTILNNFRLINWPWYYTIPFTDDIAYRFKNYFENYFLYNTYLFLPIIILILAILLNTRKNSNNKKLYFFSLFTVTLLFLIKGPAPPFGNIFYDFNKIFPLYTEIFSNIYTKYGLLLSMGYSVMMGYFVSALESRFEGIRKKAALTIILILLLVPLFIPYALKMTGPQYGYVDIPDSYFKSAKIINAYDGEGRILDLPLPSVNNFRLYKWGYVGAGIYFYFIDMPVLDKSYTVINRFDYEALSNTKYSIEHKDSELLEKLLNLYNVRFIVYHKDDIQYPDQAESDTDTLQSFTKIFSSQEIDLYSHTLSSDYISKNEHLPSTILPRIYTTKAQIIIQTSDQLISVIKPDFVPGKQNIISLDQNQNKTIPEIYSTDTPFIYFKKINPTKYKIKIENATEPFYLTFSESYDPQWVIYINKDKLQCNPTINYENMNVVECQKESKFFEIEDLIRIFDKSFPEEKHFIVNGYANAWYIDPQNLDMNKDITVTIYYKPQTYFYIGLIITGLTLSWVMVYLLRNWRKTSSI